MTKILIVEDVADNAELIRRILESRGYKTIHAWDAETGLQMALDQLPDLILLDLGLPDHDGLTLAGRLAALRVGPGRCAHRCLHSLACRYCQADGCKLWLQWLHCQAGQYRQ